MDSHARRIANLAMQLTNALHVQIQIDNCLIVTLASKDTSKTQQASPLSLHLPNQLV